MMEAPVEMPVDMDGTLILTDMRYECQTYFSGSRGQFSYYFP